MTRYAILIVMLFLADPAAAGSSRFKTDWAIELGVGGGETRAPSMLLGRSAQGGPAVCAGLAKGLSDKFGIGLEIGGVSRSGGAPDSTGTHHDAFLMNSAVTLRYRPFGPHKGPGTLHLRAGVGRGEIKTEFVRDGKVAPAENIKDSGTGFLIGADYLLRLVVGGIGST